MKFKILLIMCFCVITLGGIFFATGCCNKSDSEPDSSAGPAEKAGAELDKAMEKTVAETRRLSDEADLKARQAADNAAEKVGDVLEKTGARIEKTGADLKNGIDSQTTP